ncbi:MAG: hypothetical protein U0T74_01610 [Chitinophagales bacterium]
MKSRHHEDILAFSVLWICIIWGTYWLGVAAYYSAPNVEDFSLAIRPRDQGLIPSVVNLLVSYDSRYTDAFLHGLNPLAFNWIEGFIIMPIICFAFFVASFYFFLSSFISNKSIQFQLLSFSVLFVVAHYATETQLPCGLYLMVSTFNYIYPWFFTFIWAGTLLRTLSEPSTTKRILFSIVGYTSLILSYGCTEFFISINGFALLALLLHAFLCDKAKLKYIIPYCVVASSCVVFIFLCPSQKMINNDAISNLSDRYPNSNFILESLRVYVYFFEHYLLHPLSICIFLVATFFFQKIKVQEKIRFRIRQRELVWIFIGCIVVSYLTSWIFFIPIGRTGVFPRYTFNSILVLTEIGFWVILPLFLNKYLVGRTTDNFFRLIYPLTAILLLFLFLFSDNNINLIKQEYDAGIIQDVKRKADQFYVSVEAAKKIKPKQSIVYFENPNIIPQTNYFGPDVLPNRTAEWWNIAYEDYFKVDEVRLKGDTVFK